MSFTVKAVSIKEINRLAIPAIVAGITEPLIALADTAIIGHLGAEELGGVGIASSFYLFVVWFLAQTKSAISAIVSQAYGAGKVESVSTFVPQAIFFNFCLGILMLITGLLGSITIMEFYNASGEILQHADDYFLIRAWGFPFTLATMAIFGVFRGVQNTSWAMAISLSGGALNILLDLLLVYGWSPIVEPMGVRGAAIATFSAQVLMFLAAVVFLKRKTSFGLNPFRPMAQAFSTLLVMSLNLFVRTIVLNIAYFLGTSRATAYGSEFIAAHTIAMNIWLFSAFFIDGYSNAGNALAGKLIGQNNMSALYKVGIRLNKINLGIGSGLAIVYLLSYPWMGRFFTQETTVITTFNAVFWMVIICQPLNAIAFTFDGIYKGLGKMALLRNTLLASTLLGFVPTLLLMEWFDHELQGVWWAFLVWMIGRGGILAVHFRRHYQT